MPNLDLSDDEAAALAKLLTRTIDGDHYDNDPSGGRPPIRDR
jgi:hypothetical protein